MAGLLALILLTDARRPARTGPHGELVPLDEQDRSLWDGAHDRRGRRARQRAMRGGAVGEYQLQAAIAAVHDEAPSADDTDWPQLLALYGLLERMTGNPMVTLNRAVAVAMVHGPRPGWRCSTRSTSTLRAAPARRRARPPLRDAGRRATGPPSTSAVPRGRTTSLPEQRYLIGKAAPRKS